MDLCPWYSPSACGVGDLEEAVSPLDAAGLFCAGQGRAGEVSLIVVHNTEKLAWSDPVETRELRGAAGAGVVGDADRVAEGAEDCPAGARRLPALPCVVRMLDVQPTAAFVQDQRGSARDWQGRVNHVPFLQVMT